MDLKVYEKEEVLQPSGSEYVYVPNIIDIYPKYELRQMPHKVTLTEFKVTDNLYLYVKDMNLGEEPEAFVTSSDTSILGEVVSLTYNMEQDSFTLTTTGNTYTIANVSDSILRTFTLDSLNPEVPLTVNEYHAEEDFCVFSFDSNVQGNYYGFNVNTAGLNEGSIISIDIYFNSTEREELTLSSGTVISTEGLLPFDTVSLGSVGYDEVKYLVGAETVTNEKDLVEQECALATIWQKGNDPVDLEDGISWAECLLGEVNVIQLMQQLVEAVQRITLTVKVSFDAVTDKDGQTFLSYTLKAVG